MDVPGKFGRYDVLERVGRGGMGVLYRGKDPVLDREVAIKVMSGDFSADDAARVRFFREARAAARLQHRNIVTIFEFAEDEHGTPYIAMEFLRGRSLAQRLSTPPRLTTIQTLDIMVQLLTGLHYAHEQGIVHRDVKPANIWLMDDGTVKLLDFGVAKIASSTMTHGGALMGSASYMAPEQVAGREIDGRADVFAAGVVLYEMLTGRKPFEGDGPTAVMRKIVNEPPPPIRDVTPDVPLALAAAVTRALDKDPERRFMHAGDFGAELRLIRLGLERTSDTIADEFDAPTSLLAGQTSMATRSVAGSRQSTSHHADVLNPLADAPLGASAPVASRPGGGGHLATWIAAAALAVAVLVAAVLLFDRRAASSAREAAADPPGAATAAGAAKAAEARDPDPDPDGPGGDVQSVKLVTDPEGAAVTIDGRDAGVTPTNVPTSSLSSRRITVAKRGFKTLDVRADDRQIRSGVVLVKMEPAASGLSVELSGSYPFEVLDGGHVLSGASTRHELTLPGPRVLRLRSPEYLLDMPFKAASPSGRVSYSVPELGRLNIRTPLETCRVSIGGRDVGFPPISEQRLAAGSYLVRLTCPDGQSRQTTVSIVPGQSRLEVIR